MKENKKSEPEPEPCQNGMVPQQDTDIEIYLPGSEQHNTRIQHNKGNHCLLRPTSASSLQSTSVPAWAEAPSDAWLDDQLD